ncbi:MAG: hypothetical protein Q7K57_10715 [Burkholderiaceae bacterium]|nr:hypothetical protein [Burkholderiaceae bacterium]
MRGIHSRWVCWTLTYDELAARIRIPGIDSVERDTQFDDDKMRSAGIRLIYRPRALALAGIRDGILLPNLALDAVRWSFGIH